MASSSDRKYERGIEHLRTLCTEVTIYEMSDAWEVRVEEHSHSLEDATEYRFFAVRKDWTEHPAWPLLLGDAIQNLRSALDHRVYESANSRGRRDRRLQFPLFDDFCEFRVRGKGMLTGVPESVRTYVEGFQPYQGAHFGLILGTLRDLSNSDKHRVVTTVATNLGSPVIYYSGEWQPWSRWIDHGIGRTLEHDAHIATFIGVPEDPTKHMNVKPGLMYHVATEQGFHIRSLDTVAGVVWDILRRWP